MYKKDSFNIVAPLELGLFWDSLKRENFFVDSKYSGIWDSSVMSLTAYNEIPHCSRFINKC